MTLTKEILRAIRQLRAEEVVALPTETVYGLAGNAYASTTVQKIFALKGRPTFNPLIVHYHRVEDIAEDVIMTPLAQKLAKNFWPGPFTLVLERRTGSHLSPCVSGGLDTVAVRVPAHTLFQEILKGVGVPLAAPSANPSGFLSPTRALHVQRFFPSLLVVAEEEGKCQYGLESTVIDARDEEPRLLRQGAIPVGQIQDVLKNNVELSLTSGSSPGQLLQHYAPRKPLRYDAKRVFSGEALLAFGQPLGGSYRHMVNLSCTANLQEAAHNLFDALHSLDQTDAKSIAVMPIPQKGIGVAINDRLQRAARYS